MLTEHASFLGLPLELRLPVYEDIFDWYIRHDTDTYRAITLVCHQTRKEALPLLLRERRNFGSVQAFIDWTTRGSPQLQQHILELDCIWMTQSNSFPMSKSRNESARAQPPALLVDGSTKKVPGILQCIRRLFLSTKSQIMLILEVLQRHGKGKGALERALSSTSELRKLQLQIYLTQCGWRGDPSQNRGRDHDLETLLRIVSRSCPKLGNLSFSMDLVHLDRLRDFHNLTSLSWSGYSLSTPRETAAILSSLSSLHTIHLERWPDLYDSEVFSVATAQLPQHLGFTSDVLQYLRPLRSFSIEHMTSRVSSDYLTADMLKALSSHRESLRNLHLHSGYFVEDTVLLEILNVVSAFNLATVQITLGSVSKDYRDLELQDYIGGTVTECAIWLRYQEGGEYILEHRFHR